MKIERIYSEQKYKHKIENINIKAHIQNKTKPFIRMLKNQSEHSKYWQAISVKILRSFCSLASPGLKLMGKVYNLLRYVILDFGKLKTSTQQFTKSLFHDLKAGC